jgi:hypothetical protein
VHQQSSRREGEDPGRVYCQQYVRMSRFDRFRRNRMLC